MYIFTCQPIGSFSVHFTLRSFNYLVSFKGFTVWSRSVDSLSTVYFFIYLLTTLYEENVKSSQFNLLLPYYGSHSFTTIQGRRVVCVSWQAGGLQFGAWKVMMSHVSRVTVLGNLHSCYTSPKPMKPTHYFFSFTKAYH
jgi:hypothetical protein